jgi:magnesium-transporting ATPase (P-type)
MNQEIEKDLLLLGSTAIYDDLQDNLKDTLDYFLKTGIKVWVLTGDKYETAKSIAFSSKLILPNNKIYEFNNIENKDIIDKKLNEYILDYDLRENENKKDNSNNNNSDNNDDNDKDIYNDNNYDNNDNDNIFDTILVNKNSIELNQSNQNNQNNQKNENNQNNKNYKIRYSIIIGSEQLDIIQNDKVLENKVIKNMKKYKKFKKNFKKLQKNYKKI